MDEQQKRALAELLMQQEAMQNAQAAGMNQAQFGGAKMWDSTGLPGTPGVGRFAEPRLKRK